jgi:peptidoglycan/LPS O-acetylase OafA/YrhL
LKFHGIQSLRGIAALAVMFHHLGVLLSKEKYFGDTIWVELTLSGARGVDLFFVISGFIMMHTRASNPNRTRTNFVANRILRIFVPYYPIYFFMTAAYMIMPSIAQGGITIDVSSVIQNLFLWPRTSLETYIPVVAWTLTLELTFYLIFALTIFKAGKFGVCVFSAWMVVCLLNIWFQSPLMIFNPLNLGFGIGVLSYLALSYIPNAIKAPVFVSAVLIFTFLMIIGPDRDDNAFINIAYLLVSGVMCATSTQISRNIFSKVGDFSYSLYLCHYPVLALLFIIAFRANVAHTIGPIGLATLALVVAIVGSWIYFRVIEVYLFGIIKRKIHLNK